MIEIFTLQNVLLSVLVNAVALILLRFLKSAPPRMVLLFCLASMLAILVPWSSIGTAFGSYLPVEISPASSLLNLVDTAAPETKNSFALAEILVAIWLAIGLTWLAVTLLKHQQTTTQWQTTAHGAPALAEHAEPAFATELGKTQIYRLPNSSSFYSSGVLRPKVWIGDQIHSQAQLRAGLNHELSHIAANDQLTLLFVVTIERLLWWNPLTWMLGRQVRRQMEYACDLQCQSLLGVTQYRHTLAELLLVQHTKHRPLEVRLGNESDIITRMEKIGMTHSLKFKHVASLVVGSVLVTTACSTLAEPAVENSTLIECHELLPEGVQYKFEIDSTIDTREGETGELSVSLVDTQNPGSTELPEDAGAFLQCVQKVVGIGNDEGWPGT